MSYCEKPCDRPDSDELGESTENLPKSGRNPGTQNDAGAADHKRTNNNCCNLYGRHTRQFCHLQLLTGHECRFLSTCVRHVDIFQHTLSRKIDKSSKYGVRTEQWAKMRQVGDNQTTDDLPARRAFRAPTKLLGSLREVMRAQWANKTRSALRRCRGLLQKRSRFEASTEISPDRNQRILDELAASSDFDESIRQFLRWLIPIQQQGFAVLLESNPIDDMPVRSRGLSQASRRTLAITDDLYEQLRIQLCLTLSGRELRECAVFQSLAICDRKKVDELHFTRLGDAGGDFDVIITTKQFSTDGSPKQQTTFATEIMDYLSEQRIQNRINRTQIFGSRIGHAISQIQTVTPAAGSGPLNLITQYVNQLRDVLGVDRVSLMVSQGSSPMARLAVSATPVPRGIDLAWQAHEDRLAHVCVDRGQLLSFDVSELQILEIQSLIGGAVVSPVMQNDQIFAVLCATSRNRLSMPLHAQQLAQGCTECIQDALVSFLKPTLNDDQVSLPTADLSRQQAPQTASKQQKPKLALAEQAKRDFLATMSHEIRNPMHGIVGMTQLALETELTGKQREYLEAAQSSSESLLTVVNDILDYSKMEAHQFQLSPSAFELREQLNRMLLPFRHQALEIGVDLNCNVDDDVPNELTGDVQRLRQVLVNLLSNAFKFTKHGRIEISVGVKQTMNTGVLLEFSVSDTGIGIAAGKLPHVFERYMQANRDTATSYGGTGLGLAICKELVELMHGELHAKSELGHGSLFCFTAQLEMSPSTLACLENSRHAISDGPACRSMRVLLADDDPVNRFIGLEVLQKHGHQVTVVENGAEAVAATQRAEFDLVLLDIQMPVLDGISAAREIREWEYTRNRRVNIIAMTGQVDKRATSRCLEAGMDACLEKPINIHVLRKAVDDIVEPSVVHKKKDDDADHGLAVVQYEELLARVEGDVQLARELLGMFVASGAKYLSNIRSAIEEQNVEGARRAAHQLKGAAQSIGANKLAEITRQMENVEETRIGDANSIYHGINEAIQQIDQYAASLD